MLLILYFLFSYLYWHEIFIIGCSSLMLQYYLLIILLHVAYQQDIDKNIEQINVIEMIPYIYKNVFNFETSCFYPIYTKQNKMRRNGKTNIFCKLSIHCFINNYVKVHDSVLHVIFSLYIPST